MPVIRSCGTLVLLTGTDLSVIAAINIVVDIWILVMPIKTLKNIKRPKRDKIVLFIVFGIGAFSCISRSVLCALEFGIY